MISLIQRSQHDGLLHHQKNPVRVYSQDNIQVDRIKRSVNMAMRAVIEVDAPRIIELGCGSGDICGMLSHLLLPEAKCIGVDCHEGCLREAEKRYPRLLVKLSSIEPELLAEYDLVILCEILEHLTNPMDVAKGALSKSHLSLISHPLNEPKGSDLSAGDHQWSFSEEDHRNFFEVGGHTIDETEVFQMGSYRVILSRGHHV